jgi:hypothetical protein
MRKTLTRLVLTASAVAIAAGSAVATPTTAQEPTSPTSCSLTSLVPYLTFRNGAASVRFLLDAFGFEVTTEQRDSNDGVIHVELRRGDAG